MMRKLGLLACVSLAFTGRVAAQGIQNSDMFFAAGINSVPARTVAGGVAVPAQTGWNLNTTYGYQITRKAAASVWLELGITAGGAGSLSAGNGSIYTRFWTYAPGLRLMLPVHSRLSVYGAAGGGAGSFYGPPYLTGGATPQMRNDITWHGVADIGCGVDVRLSHYWSIRGEVRDFITGRGLSGVDGRHHRMELFGVGMHF